MLPVLVLRRLDCVLEPTKDAALGAHARLVAQGMPDEAMGTLFGRAADPTRTHPLYNTSPYTFRTLLGDPENIAPNLVSYINGFSPTARSIFERFKFTDQIENLDASNRLFTIVKAMADVDLHPDRIDNLQMGYLFEHLAMRFNEQANEEAGDHRRFGATGDAEQETFRGHLTAYRNLYAFLSQIIPYQDSDLEKLYTFVRNMMTKLPPPGDGTPFYLDDEVALRFFRLQQITNASIDLSGGDTYVLKGPSDVGTGVVREEHVVLSTLVDKLNDYFATDFAEADQLFFDQIRVSAQDDESIVEAAKANTLPDFASYLDRVMDEFFIDRMEGNEEIFSRLMTDKVFRAAAHGHLAEEIFNRVRKHGDGAPSEAVDGGAG